MDIAAHAHALLADNRYVVLATADDDGTPWATPVWFAHDGLDRLVWVSWPGSKHSQNVAVRPDIALTVFDSSVTPGEGTAFYATARAAECPDDQVDAALAIFEARSRAQGLDEAFGSWDRARVSGEARLRLYVADVVDAWVLDQESPVDERIAVPR